MLLQPQHAIGLDTHAIDLGEVNQLVFSVSNLITSAGMLGCATGYTAMVADFDVLERENAAVFTISMAFALFGINLGRASHEWGHHYAIGMMRGRDLLLGFQFALSAAIWPLYLLVETSQQMDSETGDYTQSRRAAAGGSLDNSPGQQREGVKTVELCAIVFILLLISLCVEYLLR